MKVKETEINSGGKQGLMYSEEELSVVSWYYPLCCNANILTGFGGNSGNTWAHAKDDDELDKKVADVEAWVEYWRAKGQAILTAITASTQDVGNEALLQCGFIRSNPIMNTKYPDTFLYSWYLPLNGFTSGELDEDNIYKEAL